MKLSAGSWEAVVAPERAAILSLMHAGRHVLRPTPPDAGEPFATACFPLVPYANRIASGTFAWEGKIHHLPCNHPAQAHPLHGVGWLATWQVTAAEGESVSMAMDYPGGAEWPWRFRAEQRITLGDSGLTIELAILNEDDATMPVTLGFHPYFAKAPGDRLRFAARGMWLSNEEHLPTAHTAADHLGDWSGGGVLERPHLVDHCYTGWTGSAVIARATGDVFLEADDMRALHLYVPPKEDFFCAEPVTAMPDAVNHGRAETLAPGARRRVAMRIGLSRP